MGAGVVLGGWEGHRTHMAAQFAYVPSTFDGCTVLLTREPVPVPIQAEEDPWASLFEREPDAETEAAEPIAAGAGH